MSVQTGSSAVTEVSVLHHHDWPTARTAQPPGGKRRRHDSQLWHCDLGVDQYGNTSMSVHPHSASSAFCIIRTLLHPHTAPLTHHFTHTAVFKPYPHCSTHTLFYSHSALRTFCSTHILFHPHSALSTLCSIHTLLYPHSAPSTLCSIHTLLLPCCCLHPSQVSVFCPL